MVQLKEPVDCFNEEKDQIVCRTKDTWARMNMPLQEACQEGRRVEVLVGKYSAEIAKSSIEQRYIDSFSNRVGAFIYTVAAMDSLVKVGEEHKERYQALKKEGYNLRSQILERLYYLFRKDSAVLKTLEGIREGRGDLEVPRDLNALYLLCEKYRDFILQGHFDWSMADRSKQIGLEMPQMIAEIDTDPEKIDASKILVNQAWTHLWEAQDEIYAAGRYVFADQPEIKELFKIDYLQEMGKHRTAEVEEVPAAT